MPRTRPERPHLKRYKGKWHVIWWDNDDRRRTSTGTEDQVKATQFLVDFEATLSLPPLTITLADALTRYIAVRSTKVEALSRLKEAAVPLRLTFGKLRIDQITQDQWDRYASKRVTRPPSRGDQSKHVPRQVSVGTLRREFNVLRAALRQAWKDGFLAKPPVLEPPYDSAPRERYLTKAEARALIAACIAPHVKVFVAIAVSTGARKGSILSLTWDRVHFDTGMIDFQEAGRRLTSKRRAVVPINATLLPILEEARRVAQSGYVVEFGGKPVPTGLRWSFKKLCERAGMTWAPTPHHLKHSVASWMAMERIPIDQAADWLATDPRTLRRVYRKFDPSYLRSVGVALDL